MDLNRLLLEQALQALGDILLQRRLSFEIVAVGGSGLLLLGFVDRPTRDLDVVALVEEGRYVPARPLPAVLAEAVTDVADILGLPPDWVNAGPTDLLEFGLPEGFDDRVNTHRFGGLVLHVAGRFDQICLKLYAAADQGPRSKHMADLRRLDPTADELLRATQWTRTHDPSEGFRQELVDLLRTFGVKDAAEHI